MSCSDATRKEQRRRTCQGTRANYEIDQTDYFRLELFGEYLVLG